MTKSGTFTSARTVQNVHLVRDTLSPRDFGEAIGVSESSIKRWVDEGRIRAHRTEGGHRRIAVHEAVRYVRETGATLVRPDLLGLGRVDVEPVEQSSSEERFRRYLEEGAEAEAQDLLVSLYLGGASLAAIADGPVENAMRTIGERWKEREDGIYVEHRATDICRSAIERLRLLLVPPAEAPIAVGGSPDIYHLPTLLAATVLAGEGFRVHHLGANTPIPSLEVAAEDLRPRIVWLSISVSARRLQREILGLAERLADRGGRLVIGGRGVENLGLPDRPDLVVGRGLGELAAFARGLAAH